MEQLYIEALLIHWHTGLKFSSENRNPQIPEIGRKNWPIHPVDRHVLETTELNYLILFLQTNIEIYIQGQSRVEQIVLNCLISRNFLSPLLMFLQ